MWSELFLADLMCNRKLVFLNKMQCMNEGVKVGKLKICLIGEGSRTQIYSKHKGQLTAKG